MDSYRVIYSGGVIVRVAPQLDATKLNTLQQNTVFAVKQVKLTDDVLFGELVSGNYVVLQKGELKTCEQIVRKFKVIYPGGALVRKSPGLTSAETGVKLSWKQDFEVSNSPSVVDGGNEFVELLTGGWVVSKLGEKVICVDNTNSNYVNENKYRHSSIYSGNSTNTSGRTPTYFTGKKIQIMAPPDCCSDIALANIYYHPRNPSLQISKTGHYITYRKGIWNKSLVSQSTSERSESSVQGAHSSSVVYSMEGIPLKLTDAAVLKIKHIYTGEPLLVTLHQHLECCSCNCEINCGASCCMCCSSYTAYSDDTKTIKGIWFGERDAAPISTCYSDMGCLCPLPLQIQYALINAFIKPPSVNPCTELCKLLQCCSGPPLINHISIDAYEVKIITDYSPILTTPNMDEFSTVRVNTESVEENNNPLVMNR